MEASQEGHIELVQYLIENGTAVYIEFDRLHPSLIIGAHVQQKTQTEDTGKWSRKVSSENRMKDIRVQSALGYACEGGHTEVAEVLINAGAPIDQAENEGRTPLMKASRAGHTCTVRYLITKGTGRRR
jgi:uncharacterized protein